jgi:hypothetical protein
MQRLVKNEVVYQKDALCSADYVSFTQRGDACRGIIWEDGSCGICSDDKIEKAIGRSVYIKLGEIGEEYHGVGGSH